MSAVEVDDAYYSDIMKLKNGIMTVGGDFQAQTLEAMVACKIVELDTGVSIYARSLNYAKNDQDFVWSKKLQNWIYTK